MPNIIHINAALNYSATGRIVEQLGLLAESNGYHSIAIHSARYGRESQLENYATGSSFKEKIHAIKSYLFDAQGLGSVEETEKAIMYIKSKKPDLIHLHNLHGYYINYKLLFEYLRTIKIPIVWTMHDCWMFTGHCPYFDYINCKMWQTACHNCKAKKAYPRALIDKSNRNFNLKKELFTSIENLTLVPVSSWLANLTNKSFLQNKDIRIIYNGIDLTAFTPTNNNLRNHLGIPKNKFVVLGVANNFGRRKGYKDFLKIGYSLPDVQVILVGASEKEIKDAPSYIMATGRTESQKQLADFYSIADVFVNLTYEDNFPTTNLESLACGTPVITYNTGGSPESIDEKTGIIVDKGNIAALIEAIKTIQTNKKSHYSSYCRNRAEQLFDNKICFLKYIKLYDELLNKKI